MPALSRGYIDQLIIAAPMSRVRTTPLTRDDNRIIVNRLTVQIDRTGSMHASLSRRKSLTTGIARLHGDPLRAFPY